MLKTFIGYICLEDVICQLEEKRNQYLKKRFHQQQLNSFYDCYEDDFYKEKIKNILFEYCNDVFEENTYDIFFDLTKSQYFLDEDCLQLMKTIEKRIADECRMEIHIAMSFHKDFAKWIYHHGCDQHRILSYQQAKKIFGKNFCQEKLKETTLPVKEKMTLPQLYGQVSQTEFTHFHEACPIAEKLTLDLVTQLKDKDYGIRHIQIILLDSKLHFYKKEEILRNYTNIYSDIYHTVVKLLQTISYQNQYLEMKILLCDFKDYQEEISLLYKDKNTHFDKWKFFKPHYHYSLENHSLLGKTV